MNNGILIKKDIEFPVLLFKFGIFITTMDHFLTIHIGQCPKRRTRPQVIFQRDEYRNCRWVSGYHVCIRISLQSTSLDIPNYGITLGNHWHQDQSQRYPSRIY